MLSLQGLAQAACSNAFINAVHRWAKWRVHHAAWFGIIEWGCSQQLPTAAWIVEMAYGLPSVFHDSVHGTRG